MYGNLKRGVRRDLNRQCLQWVESGHEPAYLCAVEGPYLSFWIAYARNALIVFLVLIALDWLAYALSDTWLEWYAVLALAAVVPGLMIMGSWDWDEF